MNDIIFENMTSNSNRHRNSPYKNDKQIFFNKRKVVQNMQEKKPLMGFDSDSSDEEITLDVIRNINKSCEESSGTSSLRKINKREQTLSNGTVSESSNSSDPFLHCDFLDLKIEEGDSLQSISVKYQCAISDIKRANNLISDQDIYARTHLKIPVKKYSLLTELLPPSLETKSDSTIIEEFDCDVRTINIGIGSAGRCPSPQEAAAFFKRMDEDLVKIMLSTNSQKDSLEAATVTLTSPQIQPLVKDPYNTVDCGLQWNYLLIFLIVIAVVVPALITLVMYMHSSHETHQSYTTSSPSDNYESVSKITLKAES